MAKFYFWIAVVKRKTLVECIRAYTMKPERCGSNPIGDPQVKNMDGSHSGRVQGAVNASGYNPIVDSNSTPSANKLLKLLIFIAKLIYSENKIFWCNQ